MESNHLRHKPTDLQSAPALRLRRTPKSFYIITCLLDLSRKNLYHYIKGFAVYIDIDDESFDGGFFEHYDFAIGRRNARYVVECSRKYFTSHQLEAHEAPHLRVITKSLIKNKGVKPCNLVCYGTFCLSNSRISVFSFIKKFDIRKVPNILDKYNFLEEQRQMARVYNEDLMVEIYRTAWR